MYTIDNKFEPGEECWTVYRMKTKYKCLVCEGAGKFTYNGYEIPCRQCEQTGLIENWAQTVLTVGTVRVGKIIVNINDDVNIKYKVHPVDTDTYKIKNRSEKALFKTREEAEEYCMAVNKGEIPAAF